MRVDCNNDDSHCEANSNINTYTYDKPGHLQGYSDDIWTTYSSRNCGGTGSGVDAIYGNLYDGNKHYKASNTYNTVEDCKKSCYENQECNCIDYYSNPNDSSEILCTLKKECPDDPNTTCIPHGYFNTFTYDNSGTDNLPIISFFINVLL